MGILIAVLFILAVLGQLTYHFQQKGATIIVSPIGGLVFGVNYVKNKTEYEDFETEDVVETEQHLLSISLFFISLTYIWYLGEEEVE
jgi:hypothetical protein